MVKIKIENIKKTFNPRSRNRNQVLKGVSFELPDKGLVAIFGKSGSGKTTLLNILGGLEKQDGGKIIIDGENVAGKVDKIRNAKIGFIFQNYYLERGYTISEIMRNAMLIAGFKDEAEIKRRSEEVLKIVDMERFKNKQGDALSGGQKQRVAIARALIKGADIILADEPTGNLDAQNTVKVMEILKEISKTRLVVLVTHEITLIKNYADSYIQIVDGQLAEEASLGEVIDYETEANNIYVNERDARGYKAESLDIELYGDPITEKDKIQIVNEKGELYIKAGRNVTVLDNTSERRLVFRGAETDGGQTEERETRAAAASFTKSDAKHNGRLFSFGSIFRLFRSDGEEKIYSTANIFKLIFIVAMAVAMCFFSFFAFEAMNTTVENKPLGENSVYASMSSYSEIRRLNEDLYENIDFFEINYAQGIFSYNNLQSLSGITAQYAPKSLSMDETEESIGLQFGEMPQEKEVLITRALAETLKNELRLKELQSDNSLTLMLFEKVYRISGIVEGDEPYVYMNRVDYVNFLGVYEEIYFTDSSNLFFKSEFIDAETLSTVNSFTAEICLYEGSVPDLANNQSIMEINRNSVYMMMSDTTQADYSIEVANKTLLNTPELIYITESYPMYVRQLQLTRDVMTTDIRIYVTEETLNNIFVYISPNLDALGSDSGYYFEINTTGGEQLAKLNQRLSDRGVAAVDIQSLYDKENDEIIQAAVSNLMIFLVVAVLIYLIYFFIEKSGSVRNSKEYGIYRAIGVNRSNLLFKETVSACVNNLIGYLAAFIVVVALMSVRYFTGNIAFGAFIGIAAAVFAANALLMVGISLIPYLFVLYKTPSQILSRYDI